MEKRGNNFNCFIYGWVWIIFFEEDDETDETDETDNFYFNSVERSI